MALLSYASRKMAELKDSIGDMKFSIKEMEDGTKYVDVQTDQHIFSENDTEKEMRTKARKYIMEHFANNGVMYGPDNEFAINGRAASEYTYPANKRAKYKKEKYKAATELDNILKISEFIRHGDDEKGNIDATLGWDYYLTRFMVDGVMFEGEVQIKLNELGKKFYDITKIDISSHYGYIGKNSFTPDTSDVYDESIAKGRDVVNRKFSLKEDTKSENFKKWFGDSKVVGEDGKPLVVYHGTDADVTAFDMSKGRSNMDIQEGFFQPVSDRCGRILYDGLLFVYWNRTKKRNISNEMLLNGIRRRPILPGRVQPSTFGAVGLNFCVRYGNRWNPYAIATGNRIMLSAP